MASTDAIGTLTFDVSLVKLLFMVLCYIMNHFSLFDSNLSQFIKVNKSQEDGLHTD